MMDRVWSQLQPVMEHFNHSLEHLSQRVGDLAHDVAQLKSSQLGAGHQMTLQEERDGGVEERLDARLDEVIQNIGEVKRQVEAQQNEMEKRLHSQHVMLHYNLTSFKADIDVKLKRQQKTLQVSARGRPTLYRIHGDVDINLYNESGGCKMKRNDDIMTN